MMMQNLTALLVQNLECKIIRYHQRQLLLCKIRLELLQIQFLFENHLRHHHHHNLILLHHLHQLQHIQRVLRLLEQSMYQKM
jgi:hypothetical protein